MLLSGAKKSPGGSFTEQGSPQAEGESEVFILNQSMNYILLIEKPQARLPHTHHGKKHPNLGAKTSYLPMSDLRPSPQQKPLMSQAWEEAD